MKSLHTLGTARRAARLITLIVLGGTLAGCERDATGTLRPEQIFTQLDAAVAQHYYFAEGQNWTQDRLYSAALRAIEGTGSTRQELVATLKKVPADRRRTQTYKALGAYLSALPIGYNAFIKPESLAIGRDPERSAGVGLVIRMEGPGKFLVVDSLEGSSSYRENMTPGHYLESIDGTHVSTMDLEEVLGRIRGPADSEVEIRYADETRSYRLLRGDVSFRNIINATWSLPNGDEIEYLMLRSTIADTVGQVRGLLSRVGSRSALILDLRRMHHGDLENCFGVANLFVRNRQLGGLRFRGREPVEFRADEERIFSGPIYVVLGEDSSPFAEVLAATIGSAPNVTLLGAAGQGRAFSSQVMNLDGGIELTLTNGLVLGPEGAPLYETGVPVDFTVDAPLPRNPPLTHPDPGDPVQVWLAKKLRVKL